MATDPPPPLQERALIEALARHNVDYVLVGGVASIVHGAPIEETKDFDTVISVVPENADRTAAALKELGAWMRVDGLSDEEAKALPVVFDGTMLRSMDISTWRTPVGDIDVLVGIPTRDGGRRHYDELADAGTEVSVGSHRVRLASLDHIIESKEWANRPKDQRALPVLRAHAAEQRQQPTRPPIDPATEARRRAELRNLRQQDRGPELGR